MPAGVLVNKMQVVAGRSFRPRVHEDMVPDPNA